MEGTGTDPIGRGTKLSNDHTCQRTRSVKRSTNDVEDPSGATLQDKVVDQ